MDTGFVWDEAKYETVKKDHQLYFYEVVSVFEDPNGFLKEGVEEEEDRWMWVGQSVTHRILAIVCTDEDLPLYRIITAYEAGDQLVEEYYQQRV